MARAVQVCVVTWTTDSPQARIRGPAMDRSQHPPERGAHGGHALVAPVPAAVRQRGGLLDADAGWNRANAPALSPRRNRRASSATMPPRARVHQAGVIAAAGRVDGREEALDGALADQRHGAVAVELLGVCWLSSARISAMPITARAEMSGDSNGKP